VNTVVFRYIIAWIGLVVIAIINGTFREILYSQYMDGLSAHQLSTVIGIIAFGIYIWILSKIWPIKSSRQAISIGVAWLVMTILFEFVFGHYVMGNSWNKLFADYNIIHGRVWIVVLIWTAIAPYIFFRFKK